MDSNPRLVNTVMTIPSISMVYKISSMTYGLVNGLWQLIHVQCGLVVSMKVVGSLLNASEFSVHIVTYLSLIMLTLTEMHGRLALGVKLITQWLNRAHV